MSDSFVQLQELTRPTRYLWRMGTFMAIVAMVCGALSQQLWFIFWANWVINGLILFVAVSGVLYIARQVWVLGRNIDWIEAHMQNRSGAHVIVPPAMLAPMAAMLRKRSSGRMSLSASSTRSILDSVYSRLDEGREIARYMIGLLIFLGLLGTFWGLLQTIRDIVGVISALQVGAGEIADIFEDLKQGLEAPLIGMSTAFASSLLGLASSLVLGFLDIQLGQAQNRFYNDLEEWLSGQTKLSSGGSLGDTEQSTPAYLGVLLEQIAESLNSLQRSITASGEGRGSSNAALHTVSDQLSTLTDAVTNQQAALSRLAEHAVAVDQETGIDEATRNHIRNLDIYVMRMLEENASGRNEMLSELRSELKMVSRMLANLTEHRS